METLLKGKSDGTSRIIHASSVVLASECEDSLLCGREEVDDFITRNFSDKIDFSVHQSCYADSQIYTILNYNKFVLKFYGKFFGSRFCP